MQDIRIIDTKMRPTILLIASLCYVAVFCNGLSMLESHRNAFIEFQGLFGKKYKSSLEESMRYKFFVQNVQRINKFNAEQAPSVGYKLGLNHFADRLPEELNVLNGVRASEYINLLKKDNNDDDLNTEKAKDFYKNLMASNETVPNELDWRSVPNRVSPVKDQGLYCGSCWAFATVGVLEGQEILRKKALVSEDRIIQLSEQELVDCSEHNKGCNGGIMHLAMRDIATLGGLEKEDDYVYKGYSGKCHYKKAKSVMSDSDSFILTSQDEEELKELVAKYGPVSVAINAKGDGFNFYETGVYYDKNCHKEVTHAVLIAGYGTDPVGGDYWLVKNSWGSTWGDQGYIKMARNRDNHCSIALLPTIATF